MTPLRAPERLFVFLPGDVGPGPETNTPPHCMRILSPPSVLAAVVQQAMVYREAHPLHGSIVERVLPDGAVRIVSDLSGGNPSPLVIGPRSRAETVMLRGRMEGLSLALQPGATRALLGMPVGEATDRTIPLSDLWGPAAEELGFRLAQTGRDDIRATILWETLHLKMANIPGKLLPWLSVSPFSHSTQSRDLRQQLDLGERRVQQLFNDHFGLSPRSVMRLARWHRLLKSLRRIEWPNWAALAVDHGWYDQAHLNRDFRRFSGLTSSEYFSQAISGSSKK